MSDPQGLEIGKTHDKKRKDVENRKGREAFALLNAMILIVREKKYLGL